MQVYKMELQEENTIQSQDKIPLTPKEFHCNHCPKKYAQTQNLALHVSVVHYCAACSKCKELFTYKQSCFEHVKICKDVP